MVISHCTFWGKQLVRGGGGSHWHDIHVCACFLGCYFAKFGIAIGGFSSEMEEPELHKLSVFWANYGKKALKNWVLFFFEWYTDGWVIVRKIGIEKVKFSRSSRHIHKQFWWKHPSGNLVRYRKLCTFLIILYFTIIHCDADYVEVQVPEWCDSILFLE